MSLVTELTYNLATSTMTNLTISKTTFLMLQHLTRASILLLEEMLISVRGSVQRS